MASPSRALSSVLHQQHTLSTSHVGVTASSSFAALSGGSSAATGTGTLAAADTSFLSATSDDLADDLRAEAERLATEAAAIETQYDEDDGGGFGAMASRSFLYDDSEDEDADDAVGMAASHQNGGGDDDDAGSEEYSQSHHVPSAVAVASSRSSLLANAETQYDDELDRSDDDDDGDADEDVSNARNENASGSLHVAMVDPMQVNSSGERSLPAPSNDRQFPESPIPRMFLNNTSNTHTQLSNINSRQTRLLNFFREIIILTYFSRLDFCFII